jgi:hypothetical protein
MRSRRRKRLVVRIRMEGRVEGKAVEVGGAGAVGCCKLVTEYRREGVLHGSGLKGAASGINQGVSLALAQRTYEAYLPTRRKRRRRGRCQRPHMCPSLHRHTPQQQHQQRQ